MMDYLGLLSELEKAAFCDIIGGRNFKNLFIKNSKEFTKTIPGFRAQSLSNNDAVATALRFCSKEFIHAYINRQADVWLKEINTHISELKNNGRSEDDALAETMVDSVFADNIVLYLKLSGKDTGNSYIEKIEQKMGKVIDYRREHSESSVRIKELEETIAGLNLQIEELRAETQHCAIDYDETISSIKSENEALSAEVEQLKEKLHGSDTPISLDSTDPDKLAQYDDTDETLLPSFNDETLVSLCEVSAEGTGQVWLIRRADINYKGKLDVFCIDGNAPWGFKNRDKLFFRDGPKEQGTFGIWNWSARPNENNTSKDYIVSSFNSKLEPIEIVMIDGAVCVEDIVSIMKKGYPYEAPLSKKTIFTARVSKDQCVGILCKYETIETDNGRIRFSKDTILVPVYELSISSFLRIDTGRMFYRYIFAGEPARICCVKEPVEIVKTIILDTISWTNFKQRGKTRNEYRGFKDFISGISSEDMINKVCSVIGCDRMSAGRLLDDFKTDAYKYLDGDCFDDEIISAAIQGNASLLQRAKDLVYDDWAKENESLVSEANERLQAVQAEYSGLLEKLIEAKDALTDVSAEKERICAAIAEKEKLAEAVEAEITQRIQKARDNTAAFIADMSFFGGQNQSSIKFDMSDVSAETKLPCYEIIETDIRISELEAHSTWNSVVETIEFELRAAGVSTKYTFALAAFLCAAYIEKQPVLLAGPNANDIAEALCAAIDARKHGLLFCDGQYSRDRIRLIGSDDEKTVIVENLISANWSSYLPQIISKRDVFYVVTHPFAEDIQVEPKGLFSYVMPVFTEFMVDKPATGKYFGGYFEPDFNGDYKKSKSTRPIKGLSALGLSSLCKNRVSKTLTTMHDVCSSLDVNADYLLGIIPVAYATMNLEKIKGVLDENSEISGDLRKDLIFILGDS